MTFLPIMAYLMVLVSGQQATIDRPKCCSDDRVIVVSADRNVAVALGGFMDGGDSSLRVSVYKVFRNGLPQTNWTTPAYHEGALDIRCEQKTVRVVFERLHRSNGDPIVSVTSEAGRNAPFAPPTDPTIRQQVDVACDDDARISYEHWGMFMEAYGLNDGSAPRVGPGPMVP